MKTPVFLEQDFPLNVNVWCERERQITSHELKLVYNKDNHIGFWKTCKDCLARYEKLIKLGVKCDDPKKADVMPTNEWVFLCLRPSDVVG